MVGFTIMNRGALRQHCRPAEDHNEPQAHPLHRLDLLSRRTDAGKLCEARSDGDQVTPRAHRQSKTGAPTGSR